MMESLRLIMVGAVTAVSLLAALFFLRYWKRTNDRFFLQFAVAFLVYSVGQLASGLAKDSELEPLAYVPRLLTFSLIVFAVIDKNRRSNRGQ